MTSSIDCNRLMVPREGEPSVVSLELKPVPFPVVGWIWVGGTLSMIILGIPVGLAQPSNPFAWALLFIGLTLIGVLSPPFHRRTPRRLEVDDAGIRFLNGTRLTKTLQWNRVEKIEYGLMKWHGKRRTSPPGLRGDNAYIRFIARTDLESIRVTGFDYQVKLEELERLIRAIPEVTRLRSVPFEKKDWLY